MKCLVLLTMLFLGSIAHAAITIDGTPTISGGTNDFGDDSFSHTTASDANFLFLCAVNQGWGTGDGLLNSATYNTDALTSLANVLHSESLLRTNVWYRLGPDAGANLLVTDQTGDGWYINVAVTLKGVAQSAPTLTATGAAASTTPSVTVSSDSSHFVVDCVGLYNAGTAISDPTEGTGQTQRWFQQHDTVASFGSTMTGASPNVTPDWTTDGVSGSAWGQVAVSLAPSAGRRRFPVIWR